MAKDYSVETWDSPSNAQLLQWGITREQYRSLYSKAEKEVAKSSAKWYLPKGLEYSVGDVNRFLKDQMVKTNGAYANDTIKKATTTPVKETTPLVELPSTGGGGGGGGGGGVAAYVPKYYTADELAGRFGIVNDYATILKELQDATKMKFDETETTMKRAESTNLRSQEAAYNQYLQDLRSRAANAVSSGATKGTMSANALASMLGLQDANREAGNTMNDLLYDVAQQRGTALATDVNDARERANAIGQYLGNLSTSMDTNDINAYAAQIAAEAQRYAAGAQAGATVSAARIGANSQYEQLINAFTNDYINKGYSQAAAKSNAYSAYVDYYKQMLPKQ